MFSEYFAIKNNYVVIFSCLVRFWLYIDWTMPWYVHQRHKAIFTNPIAKKISLTFCVDTDVMTFLDQSTSNLALSD